MILSIVALPLMGTLVPGLLGKYIGYYAGKYISTILLGISTILSYIVYYNVMIYGTTYYTNLGSWVHIDNIEVDWALYIDDISVTLLVTIGTISTLVHWYAIGYMDHDPYQNRFFSTLSMFTAFMILLVLGNNYMVMFLGWEMIGVASYLLIGFWYTRINAAKSGLNALLVNKCGDTLLTIGLFILLYTFGSLNYSTIFSLSTYINSDILIISMICLLIGASAKSAQLGLHTWLLHSMDGWKKISSNMYTNSIVHYNKRTMSTKDNYKYILAYDILTGDLIKRFQSKSECAKYFNISRNTVNNNLTNNLVYRSQYLFTYNTYTKLELLKYLLVNNKCILIYTSKLFLDLSIIYNTSNKYNKYIYIYNIYTLEYKIVDNITMCSKYLNVSRSKIYTILNTYEIYDNKYILSSNILNDIPNIVQLLNIDLTNNLISNNFNIIFPSYSQEGLPDTKLIWVYDIINNILVNNKPFSTYSECALYLNIYRQTISIYYNNATIYKHQYIFVNREHTKEEILNIYNNKYPPYMWEVITGSLLGDGSIAYDSRNKPNTNGYLAYTFSIKNIQYAEYLKNNMLYSICKGTDFYYWPKINPTQCYFTSKALIQLTQLHNKWYKWNGTKLIRVLPNNIQDMITPITIAHWFMEDGYFDTNSKTVLFCTDNFTKKEVLLLIKILREKFNIYGTLSKRYYYNKDNILIKHYRIRISRDSLNAFIKLTKKYIIPSMLYKLGIK